MATVPMPPCLFGQDGALQLLKECGGQATAGQLYEYMTLNYPPSACMNKDMIGKALRKLRKNGLIHRSGKGSVREGGSYYRIITLV